MRAETDGKAGERAARSFLISKGYRALFENYRTRYGEIDIIAEDGSILIFCEVKSKSGRFQARPLERVDAHKQRKLRLAAEQWLAENPTKLQPRFDVIEVFFEKGRAEVIHIENAFE